MGDASSGGETASGGSRLVTSLNLFLLVASVLGVIWTGVQLWNPIKERDVTVVLEEQLDFSLPKEASSLSKLTMMYDGRSVRAVSLLRLTVVNSGNLPIEPPEGQKEWILALRSRDQAPLELVGDLKPAPGVSVSTERIPDRPDVVHLKVQLLKAKESVSMQLAMIGGKGGRVGIEAEEAGKRIPDLRLAVASYSVRNRIMNGLLKPLLVVSVLLVLGSAIWEHSRGAGLFRNVSGPVALLVNIVALIFIVAFSSVFLAAGLSWLLSWIVYIVAFR